MGGERIMLGISAACAGCLLLRHGRKGAFGEAPSSSLAKKAAAICGMSRSAFGLATSLRSRLISSCSGFNCSRPGNACFGPEPNSLTHRRYNPAKTIIQRGPSLSSVRRPWDREFRSKALPRPARDILQPWPASPPLAGLLHNPPNRA